MNTPLKEFKNLNLISIDLEDYINDIELSILESYKKKYEKVLYSLSNNKHLHFLTKNEYLEIIDRMEGFLKVKASEKQINYLKLLLSKNKNIKPIKSLEIMSKKEASDLITQLLKN